MKQDLATAYRQMKSPNIKTRKRALKLIHEAKRFKEKITGVTGLTLWVLFFLLLLSLVQRYCYYQKSRGFVEAII